MKKLVSGFAMMNLLAIGWAVTTALTVWLVMMYAPVDAELGYSQKIFYVHIGSAAAMAVAVLWAFICSILYLVRRDLRADNYAVASAQTAAVVGAIVLITGMMWAKSAWGTFFPLTEVKLLIFLLLWVIFATYTILRRAIEDSGIKRAGSAVFAIFGFLTMPFVLIINRWVQMPGQLHPTVITARDSGMEPKMLVTLLCSVVSWLLAGVVLIIVRAKIAEIEQAFETLETK